MADNHDGYDWFNRRALLRGAAAGGLALAAGCKYDTQLFLLGDTPRAKSQDPRWADARVRAYRPLGRTGFSMSDISFGCAGLDDAGVAQRGVERGITYFDTSPDYSNAGSEKALGQGIRGTPRDQLFVVSKFCTADGHLPNDTPVPQVIAAVDASLQRLGTDHIDLIHIHAVNSLDRLMAPNIHEGFDRLKQAGKVRFLGVSSHTPDLETVMAHAVDSGRFDVIMVAYNFKNWPDLRNIFHRAHERGVGVVAMKTLKGARHSQLADFTPTERESFAQAAFKWVLSNPDVSGLVVSMSTYQQVDEYLFASGQPLTTADLNLLEKYDRLVARDYCRPGCGTCLDHCPFGVPVDDVMRYTMYAENYGWEKQAMRLYAQIDPARRADHCLACAAPCEPACDFGLPIRDKLVRAEQLLSWE
ncbi:MAG TPA: aldo/keto reductase [Candidatus Margulisiibacteriota bacterium]|nr:aldo/keto reductase [Candidatus Margulisiibacteriota bacterium]